MDEAFFRGLHKDQTFMMGFGLFLWRIVHRDCGYYRMIVSFAMLTDFNKGISLTTPYFD